MILYEVGHGEYLRFRVLRAVHWKHQRARKECRRQ